MYKFLVLFIQLLMLSTHNSYALDTAESIQFQKIIYGTSFDARELSGYRLMRSGNFSQRKAILLTEGVHGNEYMGLLDNFIRTYQASHQLPKEFQQYIDRGGIVLVVPKVNPDGISRRGRYTSFGTDLNRDFSLEHIQMQESYELAKWIDEQLTQTKSQLVLSLDYHCCAGALLYPKVGGDKNLEAYFSDVTKMLQDEVGHMYVSGVSTDFFEGKHFGTLKDYLFQKYGALAFTYEAMNMHKESSPLKQHMSWWNQLASYLDKIPQQKIAQLRRLKTAPHNELMAASQQSYSE